MDGGMLEWNGTLDFCCQLVEGRGFGWCGYVTWTTAAAMAAMWPSKGMHAVDEQERTVGPGPGPSSTHVSRFTGYLLKV